MHHAADKSKQKLNKIKYKQCWVFKMKYVSANKKFDFPANYKIWWEKYDRANNLPSPSKEY
jgi:hypothetical protein